MGQVFGCDETREKEGVQVSPLALSPENSLDYDKSGNEAIRDDSTSIVAVSTGPVKEKEVAPAWFPDEIEVRTVSAGKITPVGFVDVLFTNTLAEIRVAVIGELDYGDGAFHFLGSEKGSYIQQSEEESKRVLDLISSENRVLLIILGDLSDPVVLSDLRREYLFIILGLCSVV